MSGKDADGLLEVVVRYNRRIRLARASELALSDRLLEAESLLVSEERTPSSWEDLDLLARIRIREGRYRDALELWRTGATIPKHMSRAHRCIASLQNYAEIKFRRQQQIFVVLLALWSAAVISVVVIITREAFR